jgi:amidase
MGKATEKTTTDLAFRSATEQAELIRRGKVSPVELVKVYLERIEKLNPSLLAYVTVEPEQALEAARRAEDALAKKQKALPPFYGVPISIKDLDHVAGMRTTFSSKLFADYIATEDVAYVRRMRDAGFIILGKTNTPEFGTSLTVSELNGICRNPWNTELSAGGSSGGAGAAVAAGLCPVAHGSDGGGSIRIPSAWCGLVGLKPSRGRISLAPGLGELIAGHAVEGPMTRTVRDCAALLDVMAGYETGDPYWAPPPQRPFVDEVGAAPGKLRVALTTAAPAGAPVDPVCAGAARDTARLLESLGHTVEEAAPDWGSPDVMRATVALWAPIIASFGVEEKDLERIEPRNRQLFEAGKAMSANDYVRALNTVDAFYRRFIKFWDSYDLLLTPVTGVLPLPVNSVIQFTSGNFSQTMKNAPMFTGAANASGQPAISLPLEWTSDGLPIGIQLMGRPADEATILRVSAQLEEAKPWAHRRPPVS